MCNLNASVFKYSIGSHLDYIKIAYEFLIEAYQALAKKNYNACKNNENKIRDDLVKIAKSKNKINFPFRWITEFPDIENNNRIDIDLATPQSLIDDSNAIKIECKIVGENKYIDTKKSFEGKTPTNGIMSFITGKYSPQMPLAGMIGFIKAGEIHDKINRIKNRLQNHKEIITVQNLSRYLIKDNFKYSYDSKHKRMNKLKDILIYHLFFDFT
ncbi:MAG: hypothetical protein KAI50_12540 [Desulfobacterales bacterium]|nr:hypothetical protein [Desulfobacterales bacterium]